MKWDSIEISKDALTAYKQAMDAITRNVANIYTTKDKDGNPYMPEEVSFSEVSKNSGINLPSPEVPVKRTDTRHIPSPQTEEGSEKISSVQANIKRIKAERLVYDPNHPDADERGYVHYPDIDLSQEMVKMIMASRAYEANVTIMNNTKNMALRTLDILR